MIDKNSENKSKLPHISHITKVELYDIAKQVDCLTFCNECKYKDTNGCPAYDAPMRRTSLRMEYCNCGQHKSDSI